MKLFFYCVVSSLLGALLPGAASAQNLALLPVDTLRAHLAHRPLPDTMRVKYRCQLSSSLSHSDPATAQALADQALALAVRTHYPLGQAQATKAQALVALMSSRPKPAQALYMQALRQYQVLRQPEKVADCLMGLGSVSGLLNDSPRRLYYYLQADSVYKTVRPRNVKAELGLLANLSNCYEMLNRPAAVVAACRRIVRLTQGHGSALGDVRVLGLRGLAPMYSRTGQFDSAQLVLREARQLAHGAHDSNNESDILATLAEVSSQSGNLPQAERYAGEAATLARASGQINELRDALFILADILRKRRNPAAFDTLLSSQRANDSLQSATQTAALMEAQTRYDVAGQQAQIRDLQKDRRLATQTKELTRLRSQRQLAGVSALGLLGVLLGGGLFWQYRRRQAAARLTAAAALRTRLAADLHDDVGNLLTQISLQSGLLRESPLLPAPLLARVDALTSTARRATQQMSDAIWGLAATAPTLPDLLNHMRDHAYEVLQPLGLEPRFDTDPAVLALPLSVEARKALYLIFKEALHNIIKHAHPTEVLITLAPAHPGLALTVRNDGPTAAMPARAEGQGLASMQARAAAVGGRVQYPAQAAGFVVEAVVGGELRVMS